MDEILIANADLVDPERGTVFPGSVLVRGDSVAEVIPGPLPESLKGRSALIDATGLACAPGFIDIHAHTDGDVPCGEKLLAQGVTTAISGNCGISPLDVGAFLDEQNLKGYPVHQAELIGHSFTLRKAVGVPDAYTPATVEQIVAMKGIARAGLDRGACGISFGIQYAPGTSRAEYCEIASVAAAYGRIIPSHTRLDFPNDFDSLRETLDIAADTGGRVLVSHLAYMYADGRMDEALALIGEYRAKGADVWADSGMYTDFETYAGTTCFDENHIADNGWTYTNFLAGTGRYAGRYLDRDTFTDIRKNSPDDLIICFTGVENDIYKALRFKDVMVSSDTGPAPARQGHPQGAANFARFFRIMVRERKDLSLAEAVRRCTLLPAQAMNLRRKGRLTKGADADLVLFDPGRISDRAGFPGIGNPDEPPDGVEYVFVAGQCAVSRGNRVPGVMAGKAIRY